MMSGKVHNFPRIHEPSNSCQSTIKIDLYKCDTYKGSNANLIFFITDRVSRPSSLIR